MNPATQKVLERFIYEGLLSHNQLSGRRWRVTLKECLDAGEAEPRVFELLPGVLLYRPGVVFSWRRDLVRFPQLKRLLAEFDKPDMSQQWLGIPISDIKKAASNIRLTHEYRRRNAKQRNINMRVAQEDLNRLSLIAMRTGKNMSQVLRELIAKAAAE